MVIKAARMVMLSVAKQELLSRKEKEGEAVTAAVGRGMMKAN